MRQHPRAVPLGVSLEGRGAARRGASDADQDHGRALSGARAGAARRASVRTSGDHRGPNRARPARVPRLGRRRNHQPSRETPPGRSCYGSLSPPGVCAAVQEDGRAARAGEGVPLLRARARRRRDRSPLRDRRRLLPVPRPLPLRGAGQRRGSGRARVSAGLAHKDEFFGEQQIYRKEVRIRMPAQGGGPPSTSR